LARAIALVFNHGGDAGVVLGERNKFCPVAQLDMRIRLRVASENRSWGYDNFAGALGNLGYEVSDQTVGNVLRRHGVPPAPERKRTTTWAEFIRAHLAVLAGTDFFTVEVLTLWGLVTYYVLFFIHLRPQGGHRRIPPSTRTRGG
jgi:hypothetical protein